MRPRSLFTLIVLATIAYPLKAQNLTGTFVLATPKGDSLTLTLDRDSAGVTKGHVVGKDTDITLTGRRRAGGLAGPTTSAKGPGYFSAMLHGDELDLVLSEVNERGAPQFETAHQLVFMRKGPPTK